MKRTTIIITILFSLLSAFTSYLLFDSMEGFKTEAQESKIAVKEMQGQVNSIENKYKSEIQYWQNKNHNLIKQIQNTEVALNQSKQKVNSMQVKIQKLISPSHQSHQLAQKSTRLLPPNGKGESKKVLPFGEDLGGACDSLKEQVTQYIEETLVRDSLCDDEISGLKILVQNKDSSFADCEKSFALMKQVADSSIAMQNSLADKLILADKELRKENRKTKFLSAGLFVLSGITAALLIQK